MFVYYTYKNDEPLKAYIGMTKYPIETGYKGSGKYLWSAFKKYGKRNFTRIDLGEFDNKEECHYWEGFYIKTQKTEAKFGGYNLSPKGGLGINGCHSEETKELIRQSKLGKKHSKKQNTKHSVAMSGQNNSMFGKHQSTETRKNKVKQQNKEKENLLNGLLSIGQKESNFLKRQNLI